MYSKIKTFFKKNYPTFIASFIIVFLVAGFGVYIQQATQDMKAVVLSFSMMDSDDSVPILNEGSEEDPSLSIDNDYELEKCIHNLRASGIIKGYEDGTFGPIITLQEEG